MPALLSDLIDKSAINHPKRSAIYKNEIFRQILTLKCVTHSDLKAIALISIYKFAWWTLLPILNLIFRILLIFGKRVANKTTLIYAIYKCLSESEIFPCNTFCAIYWCSCNSLSADKTLQRIGDNWRLNKGRQRTSSFLLTALDSVSIQ